MRATDRIAGCLDFVASLDWIERVRGFALGFKYADWAAAKADGLIGLLAEMMESLVGANRWTIWVPRNADWSGSEIQRFLAHYGIPIWDRGFVGQDICFSVKERQADWAEYLLLRRGIQLSGPFFNPANQEYARRFAPGNAPPAWIPGPVPGGPSSRGADDSSPLLTPIPAEQIRRALDES